MNKADPIKPSVIKTRPVKPEERFMQERFSEAIADQSKLMDSLAQQLLLIELAIPSLYATILKLLSGSDKVVLSPLLTTVFILWLAAVILNIVTMIPRSYKDIERQSPDSIEAFFDKSAHYKRVWLLGSVSLFILGIILIVTDLI